MVQRFRPDNFFTVKQQLRLRELMNEFYQANTVGEILTPAEKQELEILVDAEWNAALERSKAIIKKT